MRLCNRLHDECNPPNRHELGTKRGHLPLCPGTGLRVRVGVQKARSRDVDEKPASWPRSTKSHAAPGAGGDRPARLYADRRRQKPENAAGRGVLLQRRARHGREAGGAPPRPADPGPALVGGFRRHSFRELHGSAADHDRAADARDRRREPMSVDSQSGPRVAMTQVARDVAAIRHGLLAAPGHDPASNRRCATEICGWEVL
jgi:hypothetical protein